jgi:hypothetical protein
MSRHAGYSFRHFNAAPVLAAALAGILSLGGPVQAEVMRSETMQAELARRTVAMTSPDGASLGAEQVYVTLSRLDGQPIGVEDLPSYVGFAERAACQGRKVMVSLMVSASAGAGKYEVLCAKAQ